LQKQSEPFPKVVGDEAYIVDVPLNQKTIGSLQNIHVSKIVWIDHHEPEVDVQSLPANLELRLDSSSPSAVLLVQKYFGLNDEISQKITELGTKADTWKINSEVQEWIDLLDMYLYFKLNRWRLIRKLAEGHFEIKGSLKRKLEEFKKIKENEIHFLLEHTVVRKVKGHLVAIGLAHSIPSASESADVLLKNTNSEIQIVIKTGGFISFRRSPTSQVNLLQLARLFGGGGHEKSAGGRLGREVIPENFIKVAEEIFEKISEVLP
jgi:oligoribonuclease NrnB/cAMP/cGMP phosphodiesterase (DHH superfamily)